jgi:[acyl-carrier-protein] S-malonyltransferase
MLSDLLDQEPVATLLEQAQTALDQNITQLITKGPAEELALTLNTQPIMLTMGIAVYRAWQAAGGPAPTLMAGHSLGEYTALVAAHALDFVTAIKLVRFRAQAMQDAVPVGAGGMAAILGLSSQAVQAICQEVSATSLVEAVNFNAPEQTVIAGTPAGIAAACDLARTRGAKRALPLPVSAPFHSSLMAPTSIRLQEHLTHITCASPTIPVINNVDVRIEQDADAIKHALVRQAAAPVRWVETIQAMADQGITHIIECGPGKVLAGLSKRIAPEIVSLAITDKASLHQALTLVSSFPVQK